MNPCNTDDVLPKKQNTLVRKWTHQLLTVHVHFPQYYKDDRKLLNSQAGSILCPNEVSFDSKLDS